MANTNDQVRCRLCGAVLVHGQHAHTEERSAVSRGMTGTYRKIEGAPVRKLPGSGKLAYLVDRIRLEQCLS